MRRYLLGFQYFFLLFFLFSACQQTSSETEQAPFTNSTPPTSEAKALTPALMPPMGWRDTGLLSEESLYQQLEAMVNQLAGFGWEYVLIDPFTDQSEKESKVNLDQNGLPVPNVRRFASSANSKDLKYLADKIHAKTLKWGVVFEAPIIRKGLEQYSSEDQQQYYDLLFQQLARWEVDFVHIHSVHETYNTLEIEAIHKAISACGRPMVFSFEIEHIPTKQAAHILQHINIWSVSSEPIKEWKNILEHLNLLRPWGIHVQPFHFAMGAMIPISSTSINYEEQKNMLSLWAISRSPLFITGDLTQLSEEQLALLTNEEVIALHQFSRNQSELYISQYSSVWVSDDDKTRDLYFAFLNTTDEAQSIYLDWRLVGWSGSHAVRDLWAKEDLGVFDGKFEAIIPAHGGGLYRAAFDESQ